MTQRNLRVPLLRGCAAVVGSALLLAGCSNQGTAQPEPSATGPATPVPTSGVRGVPVAKAECSEAGASTPNAVGAKLEHVVDIESLVSCEWRSSGLQQFTISTSSAAFPHVIASLSAPDEAPTTGVCAMYVDVQRQVIAITPTKAFAIHIPVDECNHYQTDALAALNNASKAAN
jgi:hypothetical protein